MEDARQLLAHFLSRYVDLYGAWVVRPEQAIPRQFDRASSTQTQATMVQVDLFGNPISGDKPSSAYQSPYECVESLIPEDSPLREMRTLEEVRAYLEQHILVPIDKLRTHAVFGDGNPQADLMVVGEAPGAEEDRQGKPFVGRAGQLLTKMLAAIGFRREDVYITNVVKSRPPANRDPLPEEIKAHIPILYKEIALVQPKIILCLGRVAGNALLGTNRPLKALRGKLHDFCGLPVVVTYHPAALLRNPQWKRAAWEDLQLLKQKYEELTGHASSSVPHSTDKP